MTLFTGLLLLLLLLLVVTMVSLLLLQQHDTVGKEALEQFFDAQQVDHLNPNDDRIYAQRYYTSDHLAKNFGAFVLEPEHRFYGKSQPIDNSNNGRSGGTGNGPWKRRRRRRRRRRPHVNEDDEDDEDPRVKLFTPEQALHDAMSLLEYHQHNLGCSKDKFSKKYCPVITVGGSYPGFLSAFARILFPGKVDMAYAASAPMGFYSQEVGQYDYYNHISKVANATLPGCASAVRRALLEVQDLLLHDNHKDLHEADLGICAGSIPNYIYNLNCDHCRRHTMVDELMMVVGYTFANDNMANYPPTEKTRLYQACQTFSSPDLTAFEKVKEFLVQRLPPRDVNDHGGCWDMTLQLPTGPNATISGGDWSGDGTGRNGESWDFQTCTLLVEAIGFSEDANVSMFPRRDWSIEWMTHHCQSRFGVTPRPYEYVQKYKLDDLAAQNVTRILFTNGLNDGWQVGGIHQNLSDSLIALDFPNGAHHSDLSHVGPSDADTDDIRQGFETITTILGNWLEEVKSIQEVVSEEV